MRAHTRAVSMTGSTAVSPYVSAWRIVCAALPEASSALDGTQPVHRQSPPTRWPSTHATLMPSFGANSAATMPAEPMPMMMRSYFAKSSNLPSSRCRGYCGAWISRLRILPVGPFGSSSTNQIRRGYL